MEQQTETLIQVFHALDANGDGHLSREEFRRACGTDDDRLDNIFDIIDADSNGEIDLQEFLQGYSTAIESSTMDASEITSEEERLRAMFDFMDKDKSGTISFEELTSVAEEATGKQLSEVEKTQIRLKFHIRENTQLDFERFTEVVGDWAPQDLRDNNLLESISESTEPPLQLSSRPSEVLAVDEDNPILWEARQEIQQLEKRLRDLDDDRLRAVAEADDLRFELEAAQQEAQLLRDKYDKCHSLAEIQRQELSSSRLAAGVSSQELDDARAEHLKLAKETARLKRLVAEKDRKLARLEEGDSAEREALKQSVDGLNDMKSTLQEKFAILSKELEDKEAQWAEEREGLSNHVELLRKQLDDLTDELERKVCERDDLLASALAQAPEPANSPPVMIRRLSLAEELETAPSMVYATQHSESAPIRMQSFAEELKIAQSSMTLDAQLSETAAHSLPSTQVESTESIIVLAAQPSETAQDDPSTKTRQQLLPEELKSSESRIVLAVHHSEISSERSDIVNGYATTSDRQIRAQSSPETIGDDEATPIMTSMQNLFSFTPVSVADSAEDKDRATGHNRSATLLRLSEDEKTDPSSLLSVSGARRRLFQAPKEVFVGDYLGVRGNSDFLRMIHDAGGQSDEIVLFTDVMYSISSSWLNFGRQLKRTDESRQMVVLTNKGLYNIREYLFGLLTAQRRIPLQEVSSIVISTKGAGVFVIKVPSEHDYMYRTARWMELVSEIRKAYTEVTQRRLDVEFSDDITIRTPEGIHARALINMATQTLYLEQHVPTPPGSADGSNRAPLRGTDFTGRDDALLAR